MQSITATSIDVVYIINQQLDRIYELSLVYIN
jgi:hypothetical protein